MYFSWCLCVFIFRSARFICQISPRPQVIPGRYISRSVARIGSRVVAVVIWANIQHLSREIFVARSNNSIPRGPLPQPLPLPLQLSLRGNEIMNDVILLPLRCFHSRGAHDMPRPYLICYIYIACEIGNWQLDLLLAGFWLPVKRYPHPSAQFPIQSCCRVCVISAGNERSRAIICRRLCRRAEAFRP